MNESGPREDAYDVVVVGAGLAGLSAAASLAKVGKKVLAVERQDGAGGYARAFRRGDYVFDPAIHVTPKGFGSFDFWDIYLGALGVKDRVELLDPAEFYGVVFPDLHFHAPSGIEPYIDAHVRQFPHEAEGIKQFVGLCMQITAETQQLSTRLTLGELEQALEQFPIMFRYRTTTLAEVLADLIGDPKVRAVLAGAWPYLGLPPSRLSLVQYGAMMAAIMEKGPGYAKGSFQSLVDAFVAAIEQNGGELLLDSRVTAIPIEDGRVAGVVLEDGRAIRSEQVISAIDAKQTLEELVGLDRLPDGLVRRYRRMKPSLSAFVIYAATTLDVRELDLAHETFVYRSWDHEEDFRNVLEHRIGGSWLSLPTLHDPSVAPEGEHLVVFTIFTPYDIGTPWEEARERYTQLLVDEVEALMPGFRDSMTYLDAATPLTFERYTSNQQGAVYGWENTPQQSQPKRLQHRLPIEGLFLAGHWTEPGSSSFRVVYSGLQAASSALGYESSVEFMGALYGQPV